MKSDLARLPDRYLEWLRQRIRIEATREYVEITLPYLDRHRDFVQLYIEEGDGQFVLTDDGVALNELLSQGFDLTTPARIGALQGVLDSYQIQRVGQELRAVANEEALPARLSDLALAVVSAASLNVLNPTGVARVFIEDAKEWLLAINKETRVNYSLRGNNGFDHRFDFFLPRSSTRPPRYIEALRQPDRQALDALSWAWVNTSDARGEESLGYVFLNDDGDGFTDQYYDALRRYDLQPVPWSRRHSVAEQFAA